MRLEDGAHKGNSRSSTPIRTEWGQALVPRNVTPSSRVHRDEVLILEHGAPVHKSCAHDWVIICMKYERSNFHFLHLTRRRLCVMRRGSSS